MAYFTIFHLLIIFIVMVSTFLVWVLLYIKVKNKKHMFIFCIISFVFAIIISVSLSLTIDQYTKKASLSNFSTYRRLAHESIIVKGRVTNETRFKISRCFLELRIANDTKHDVSGKIFDNIDFGNVKKANKEKRDVTYNINIANNLSGNTYKDFSFEISLPPQFQSYKTFTQLKCY